MGPYLGDFISGSTLHHKWDTNNAAGASVTRATDGGIWVYRTNATGSETQVGVTDTEDFDGLTGIHHIEIDTSDAFYIKARDYAVVLKAAVIDGQTVNAVLCTFSIENRRAILANVEHGGASASLALKFVYINNSTGSGAVIISSGSNGNGLLLQGDGSGDGLECIGGGTGKDINADEIGDVVKINGVANAAVMLALSAGTISKAIVQASPTPTTTECDTDLTLTNADQLKGRVLIFTDGNNVYAQAVISASTVGGLLTYSALPVAPASGDILIVI